MHEVMQPTQEAGWVLTHEGYNVLTESAVEIPLCAGQWVPGRTRGASR